MPADPPRPPPGLSLKAVGHAANATNTSATSSTSGNWKSPPSPVSNTSTQDISGSTMNSNISLNSSSSSIYAQSSFTGNSSSGVGAGSDSTPSPPTPSPSEQLVNTSTTLNTTGGSTADAIGYNSSDGDDSSDDSIDGSSSAGSDRSGNSTTNSDSRLGSSNSSDSGTRNSSSSSSAMHSSSSPSPITNSSGSEPSMGLSTPPQAASSSPPTSMLTSPLASPPSPPHSLPGSRHRTNGSGLRPGRHRRHRPPRPTPSTTFGEPTQSEGTPLPRQHSQAGGPLPGGVSSSSPPPPTSLVSGAGSTPGDPVLAPSLTTGGTPPPAGGHAAVALPPVTPAVPDGSAGGEEAVPGHAPAALLLSPGGSVQGGADTHKPLGAAAGGVTVMATQAFTSVTEMAAAAGRWAVQEDIIMYTGSAAFVLVLVAGFLVSRRLGWQLRSPLNGSNRPGPGGPSSGPSRSSQPYLPLSSAPRPSATAAPVDGWDNWSDDEEAPGGQPGWGSSPASGPTAKKAQLKTGPGGTHYNSIPSTADLDPPSSAAAAGAGQGSGAPGVSRESAPLPPLSPRPARAALSIAAPEEPAARSGRTRPLVREDRAAASHRNGRRGGSNGIAGTATLGAGKGKAGSSSSLSLAGSDRGDSGTEAAPQPVGRGKLGAVKLKPTAPSAHRDDW
ncbi:hypothetical protein QJQ45_002329 [Haematococcus lacustris]|nr:hypothetical protein QJQ45_002329 [Haematococcus lacustris]